MTLGSYRLLVLMVILVMGTAIYQLQADEVAKPSPQEVVDQAGLTRMGFLVVLPDEADIRTAAESLRQAKQRLANEASVRGNLEREIDSNQQKLDQIEQTFEANSQQLARNPKNNQYVAANNQLVAIMDQQKERVNDLRNQLSKLNSSRSNYLTLAMDLSDKAEAAAAKYAILAKNAQLADAIAHLAEPGHTPARLGPSGLFQNDLDFIRQCKKDVETATIPVDITDNVPEVEVQLNGKLTTKMIWDSGASFVSLNYQTAKQIGLTPRASDPKIESIVADGRVVKDTVMVIDSIRIGAFTVHHVQCEVDPPDVKDSPNLLGDTFQSHFVARMDMTAGQLHLTPLVNEPTRIDPIQVAPSDGGTQSPDSNSDNGQSSELLDTMHGSVKHKEDGAIVLTGNERISTALAYSAPVKFNIVAMTDSTDIHIAYAAKQIIFNSEENPDQLRIDGGPANGRTKDGAGRVPTNQWVNIGIEVTKDSMRLTVDGKERYSTNANFARVHQHLAIFPAEGSTIKVKSVTVSTP